MELYASPRDLDIFADAAVLCGGTIESFNSQLFNNAV